MKWRIVKVKAVRVECEDRYDRSMFIPLVRVEEINLNVDGIDTIRANGEYYICFNGMFQVSDLSFFENREITK